MKTRLLLLLLLAIGLAGIARAVEAPPTKRVALVFDDGPRPADVEALLPILAKENLHVTFSFVGDRVDESPAAAKAVAAAGHEVANHSQTHAHPKKLDDAALDHEVGAAQEKIRAATGVAPRWYWPPYLESDDRLRGATARAGLTLYPMQSVVVSMDYNLAVPAGEIFHRATTDVKDGSVILFHEWRKETRDELPAILAELRRQGCVFLTFSALQDSLAQDKAKAKPVAAEPVKSTLLQKKPSWAGSAPAVALL
ncbi:MAG TPA: polysaccharide deacetylase family protein [Candidatus Didemnitutus sp.]|nr:polysaccharide deacetylase family protein [Candidatus Didemnitutus sp.]